MNYLLDTEGFYKKQFNNYMKPISYKDSFKDSYKDSSEFGFNVADEIYNYKNKCNSQADLNFLFMQFTSMNKYIKDIQFIDFNVQLYSTKIFIYIIESEFIAEKFINNINEETIIKNLTRYLNNFMPYGIANDFEFIYE